MNVDVYVCQCGILHFAWTLEFGFFEAALADQYCPHLIDEKTESEKVVLLLGATELELGSGSVRLEVPHLCTTQ